MTVLMDKICLDLYNSHEYMGRKHISNHFDKDVTLL